MKKIAFLACAPCLLLAALPSHADTILKNSTVSSTLTVTGSPSFLSSDTFGTKANVGSTKEFDATTTAFSGPTITPELKPISQAQKMYTYENTYSANFSNALIVINNTCTDSANAGCATYDPYPAFTMTFFDPAFANWYISADPAHDPAGYSFSYNPTNDLLTVNYAGGTPGGGAPGAFDLEIAPAPEPGSLVLFGTGLVAAAGFARRRLFA